MTDIVKRPRKGRGRHAAVALGIRQADVSAATGIPQSSLSKMLGGKLPMADDDLEAIVRVVGEPFRDALKKVQKKPVPTVA